MKLFIEPLLCPKQTIIFKPTELLFMKMLSLSELPTHFFIFDNAQ